MLVVLTLLRFCLCRWRMEIRSPPETRRDGSPKRTNHTKKKHAENARQPKDRVEAEIAVRVTSVRPSVRSIGQDNMTRRTNNNGSNSVHTHHRSPITTNHGGNGARLQTGDGKASR